ncbi:MAG: leucine-rich repeat domain-containing protein [Clostridiales bacterium]|nr:leucine-rich repeat domain-containing protein [Clostridiales bacterium]
MKKSVSLFCVVTMFILVMLGTVPAYALTQTEDIEETQILESDTYYSFDAETKTLIISGDGATPNFSNSSGSTNSQPWYSWRSDGSIEHIVVEEGITSLGTYFFYNITTADISLPSTLLSIGNYAMARTNSNSTVILPEGLETISNYVFYNTSGLVSMSIPSTVTSIGMSAFESCTSLESVEFANLKMTVSIGKKAFLKCSSLTTVTVPKYATLSDYSFGYSAASAGSLYSDFVMRVYRDSDAYTFALSKAIAYEIIDTYDITEGGEYRLYILFR